MSNPNFSLRAIEAGDMAFLKSVYVSTRQEEMAQTGWTREQIDEFLGFQFNAQHQFYQMQYPDAQYAVILLDGEPVGRLYLDRREDEHRVVDIALLPQYRGKGLGYALMRDVLLEALAARKPVRIHVEQNNPALRLYKRLGFQHRGDNGVYYLMEWQPNTGHNP